MTESIQAAPAASGAATTATAKSAVKSTKSFAGELAAATKVPARPAAEQTRKVPARPDGEQTRKVAGHPYARILNGDDKGLYLNQVAGSARQGAVFRLVERGDRVYHVYGDGKDKLVIGLPAPGAPKSG